MVKVSVVVPVYNVEDYLAECLDSIVNQTLDDIEIICINDGSPDNSLEILREYEARDDRITVIDQENGGHAVATNRGMDLAKGKYLFLMDSDDILDIHALEETYKVAEERQVDFVIFQAINYYMDTGELVEQENYSMNEIADRVGDSVFDWKDVRDLAFDITVTPWSKLYNREFVMKNNCRFSEGLVFDDNIFFWEVFFSAERITFLRKHLFKRRWHSESSTMSGGIKFMDSIEIFKILWKTFQRFGTFEEYKETLYRKRVVTGYWRMTVTKEEFQQMYFEKYKESLLEIQQEDFFDDFYNTIEEKTRKIYDTVITHDDYREVILIVKNYDLEVRNDEIRMENLKLKYELRDVKKLNNQILNSRSWKATKPLRSIKNKLR